MIKYSELLDSYEAAVAEGIAEQADMRITEPGGPYAMFLHPDDYAEVFFKYHSGGMSSPQYKQYVADVAAGLLPEPVIPQSIAWEDTRIFPDLRVPRGKFRLAFGESEHEITPQS